ncbi:MAG: glycoside-pentoside-hexuronide (GPH):cation symporter [Myxococcota bacterium]|jgi:sugar (glycoside-pentoside-hexuronide) transporter|nr:glycoside-pentoside-hexuronide (GPH):cation symporter [Myxococcota bacterium]
MSTPEQRADTDHLQGSRPTRQTSFATIFDYNLPMVSVGFMFLLVNMYLMKFATDTLHMAPAVIGMIFGFSRIWDAITDPVAGYWSDRTQTRVGRRRPWLLGSILPLAAAFYMLWNPPPDLSGTNLTLWMTAGVFLFYTSMTVVVVPHQSLGAELSDDPHDRTRIFGGRHVAWILGSFGALAGMSLIIESDGTRLMASRVSIFIILVSTVFTVWMVARVKERPEYQGRGSSNPFRAYRDVFRNRHARILLAVFLVESLGAATINALTVYVAEYVVGTPRLAPLYILLYMIPSAAAVPFWVWVSGRLGKKYIWTTSTFFSALGFGGMFLLQEGDVIVISVLAVLLGFFGSAGAVVAPSIQADVIDFDELETGDRKEGAYFAAWNFVYKFGVGVTLMLTGFVLEASGFVPNKAQGEEALFALKALYALFPLCCYLIATFLLTRFGLDEAEHARIRRELDARRA